jgi:hypothetical protein
MSRGARKFKRQIVRSMIGLVPIDRDCPTDIPLQPAETMGLQWERVQLVWPHLDREQREMLAQLAEKFLAGVQ